jgi:hypothetical protein
VQVTTASGRHGIIAPSHGPATRVHNPSDLLRWLDRSRPSLAAKVRRELDPAVLDRIEHGPRLAWLPLTDDVQFLGAIHRQLGRDGCVQLWREYLRTLVETPLLKGLFEAAVRTFGLNVATGVKAVPKVMGSSFRDCGELEAIRQDDGSMVLMHTDAPELFFAQPVYLALFEGLYAGLYDLIGRPPALEFDARPATRTIIVVFPP